MCTFDKSGNYRMVTHVPREEIYGVAKDFLPTSISTSKCQWSTTECSSIAE